ncbi:MAG TPA: 7-cyano-7-deazaguanine synthase QueC, partial [Campylobacterales bacterium]|nr:7-cyano-7-deazaguanine synthase QueC [Campylobacterales bacterium]
VPLHFSYGQRTEKRELQAFHDISNSLNVIGRYTIQLPFFKDIGIGTTSLIDRDMQINEKGVSTSSIPNSYVPFRNGIMLSIATAVAEKEGAEGIAIGVVEEDSSGYPDCRENFISTFEKSINLGTKQGKFRIFRPLVNLHKSEIVREAIRYGVPLHLTWSCYQREDKACGVCDSCRLRLNGFKLAGVKDPIEYVENTKYKG